MADIIATLTSIYVLFGTASIIISVSLFCQAFSFFKPSVTKYKKLAKISLGIALGFLAILGTLMGTKLPNGTIVNVRELAAMIAGIAGGPVVGVIAGLIGGVQRYTVGGATALSCTISTVLIGLIAGLISNKITGRFYLLKAATLGLVLESGAMGLILLLVQPFNTATSIVSQIAIPMISANTIGLTLWVYLAYSWKNKKRIKV